MKKLLAMLLLLAVFVTPAFANGDSYPTGEAHSYQTIRDDISTSQFNITCSSDSDGIILEADFWDDVLTNYTLDSGGYEKSISRTWMLPVGEHQYRWCCHWVSTFCTEIMYFNITENETLTYYETPSREYVDCTSLGCDSGEQTTIEVNWLNGGVASDDGDTSTAECTFNDWYQVNVNYFQEYDKVADSVGGNYSFWYYNDSTGACTGLTGLTNEILEVPSDCWDYDNDTVTFKVWVSQNAGDGYERTYVSCQNGSSSWNPILQVVGEYDDYGMPMSETGMQWLFAEEEPPAEESTGIQAIMEDVGAGTGAFLSAIATPVMNVVMIVAVVVGTVAIVTGIAIVFKGIL